MICNINLAFFVVFKTIHHSYDIVAWSVAPSSINELGILPPVPLQPFINFISKNKHRVLNIWANKLNFYNTAFEDGLCLGNLSGSELNHAAKSFIHWHVGAPE